MEGLLKNVLRALVETLDEDSNKKRDVVDVDAIEGDNEDGKNGAGEKQLGYYYWAGGGKDAKADDKVVGAVVKEIEKAAGEMMVGKDGAGEEDINCDEHEIRHTTQSPDKKALETVSGKYNGDAFVTATNGENSIVPGELIIKGLKEPLKANFTFTSIRYMRKGLGTFHEELKVHTKHGACTADALYKDAEKEEDLIEGNAVLSTTEYADYFVETSTGELRDLKGHYFRIHFDNKEKCKPRTISVVPGPGSDKKDAKILE